MWTETDPSSDIVFEVQATIRFFAPEGKTVLVGSWFAGRERWCYPCGSMLRGSLYYYAVDPSTALDEPVVVGRPLETIESVRIELGGGPTRE